jgi:2-deoxy-D-gluconate 3-dehydrogenase
VIQLTKAMANDWAKYGIRVNAISPGYIETIMNEGLLADSTRAAEILSRTPVGRWGTPEDLKGIAVLLASDASDFISGAIIPVDGGYSAW